MNTTFTAWAIDTNSEEGHSFIGRYYFCRNFGNLPRHIEGCRIALFKTRKLCRDAVKLMKPAGGYHAYPKARAVKIQVHVIVVE